MLSQPSLSCIDLYLSLVNLVVKGSYFNPNFDIVVIVVAIYII